MSRLDKLDKVAAVARADQAGATRALQQQQRAHRDNATQLEQLQAFAREYEMRLQQLAATGMPARQLQDYRLFLANLSAAIALQAGATVQSEEAVGAHRDQWIATAKENQAMSEYLARERLLAQQQRSKVEQSDADERSAARTPTGL